MLSLTPLSLNSFMRHPFMIMSMIITISYLKDTMDFLAKFDAVSKVPGFASFSDTSYFQVLDDSSSCWPSDLGFESLELQRVLITLHPVSPLWSLSVDSKLYDPRFSAVTPEQIFINLTAPFWVPKHLTYKTRRRYSPLLPIFSNSCWISRLLW